MDGIFRRHRIGSVPYLNARPLTEGLEGQLIYDVPARLAERFARGELDAALLPIFEAIADRRTLIGDDMAIASRGAVYSVFLAHREPVAELRAVALDPASHTSNRLLQCLLAEYHGIAPEYVASPRNDSEARLLIGDPAMEFRGSPRAEDWQFLDLGAEWMRCTGLPFVFAAWVIRDDIPDPRALADALRGVKARGLESRARIAAAFEDPDFVQKYLTDSIRFDLREDEKRAIALFAELLLRHGLVGTESSGPMRYV